MAESTTSAMYCAEAVSQAGVAPEDIALQATRALLDEVQKGGCVDQKHQSLVLIMMVLGSEDVGRCRMSLPTARRYAPHLSVLKGFLLFQPSFSVQLLRDIKDFFGTSFKVVPTDDGDSQQLLYSCYGTGYVNANRTLA